MLVAAALAATAYHIAVKPVARARRTSMSSDWAGDLSAEVEAAVAAVQRAMRLCNALAGDMELADGDATSGISLIKAGDDTPVTAADFAIQGMISGLLRMEFPQDRFMGEEDAAELRAEPSLCALAQRLCSEFSQGARDAAVDDNLDLPRNLMDEGQRESGLNSRDTFLADVDRGLEPPRGEGERCWVLDPIDGTKGFMTGQGFVIGLALLDAHGDALVGVMGVPPEAEAPPIMAAARGRGLRWFNADGAAPLSHEPPKPDWADGAPADAPPWLISPQSASASFVPFGEAGAGLQTLCCGSMIKYHACAAGRVAGFVQFEEELKTWDHACGLICVAESGGAATDAQGRPVVFPGRGFKVDGGVVCASRWASPEVRQALLDAAKR